MRKRKRPIRRRVRNPGSMHTEEEAKTQVADCRQDEEAKTQVADCRQDEEAKTSTADRMKRPKPRLHTG
jgi:hypothetical protein